MIRRMHPPSLVNVSPLGVYSVLFLGQGFTDMELYEVAWRAIDAINTHTTVLSSSRYVGGAWWEGGTGVDLKIKQQGSTLFIEPPDANRLAAYLAGQTLAMDDGGTTSAAEVWPAGGRFGRTGGLVAVLRKAGSAGELYQLRPSDNHPVPLVAVNVFGEHWRKVVVRAVGETFAGLADEYELSGDKYAEVPEGVWTPAPNVIFVTTERRAQLAGGAKVQDVVPDVGRLWGYSRQETIPVRLRDASTSPSRLRHQFVEGAAHYRAKAFRSSVDCLMRRRPNATVATERIQDDIDFCDACENVLRQVELGNVRFAPRRRATLDKQLLLFDTIGWQTRQVVPAAQTFPVEIGPLVSNQPAWRIRLNLSQTAGLIVQDIELHHRDSAQDPYYGAVDILKEIRFEQLSIQFNDGAAVTLSYSDAFANTVQRPKLEWGFLGGPGEEFQIGVKLTLAWNLSNRCTVEVASSVLFRKMLNDFDPGGAAEACKFYPQMAMRFRQLATGAGSRPSRLPTVQRLRGVVVLDTNNVIPTALASELHDELKPRATGKQCVMLMTDSNSSDWDNRYDFDEEDIAELGAGIVGLVKDLPPTPDWGLWEGKWKEGRKLAGVIDAVLTDPDTMAGGTARKGYELSIVPGLPHWSWLFDYGEPFTSGTRRFVAVYHTGERTKSGNDDASVTRDRKFAWPLPADQVGTPKNYEMTIRKMPRQGEYDNVHVHADLGMDSTGRHLMPAPFCADLCMHLHWRWGTVALGVARVPYPYLGWGWGNDRFDEGAESIAGAPLIPPNQHLEIEVKRISDSETQIVYDTIAYRPKVGEWQVFLEQGLAIAFSYGGVNDTEVAQLAGAVGAIKGTAMKNEENSLKSLRKSDPAAHDRRVRGLFRVIYERIRWYNPGYDKTKPDVQQVPAVPNVPAELLEL